MSAQAPPVEPRPEDIGSPFFVWAAGYCVFLTFAGFTPTYWAPITTASSLDLSPVVHIHGGLFFIWTTLFLLQSRLASRGQLSTHRNLGLLGISLATAMVITGFIVSLLANIERIEAGQLARAYSLGFSNSFALIAFAALFGLAIYRRRRPDSHQRLMLFATCMLMNPPVGRLYRPLFAPSPPSPWAVFATIDVILVACLIYDFRVRGRPHPVTLGSGVALLVFQIIRFPIPAMEWWQATYDVVLRLVG